MVNALKRLDKKILILIGLIIFFPLFIIILLAVFQGCQSSKITYEKYEEKMLDAAEKYVSKLNNPLDSEGEYINIELSTLIENGYIKNTKKLVDDESCKGSVSVRRNGASIEANNGGYLNYIVDLNCDNYKTVHLVDKLKEDITTSGAGLYSDGLGYVYKGKNVDNYIKLFNQLYFILGIDENNILKLVKTKKENVSYKWDNKYNVETGALSGINKYEDSLILEQLILDYNNSKKFNVNTKNKIVAYDVCIGKRVPTNYAIDSSLDCSSKLEKQVISLMNASDYAKASLDENCKDLNSFSCNNYNYLYQKASTTWTLNASMENSYDAMYISNGLLRYQESKISFGYNIVIYIDGNQIYKAGKGTYNEPYEI